jgi:hypothetical protein
VLAALTGHVVHIRRYDSSDTIVGILDHVGDSHVHVGGVRVEVDSIRTAEVPE